MAALGCGISPPRCPEPQSLMSFKFNHIPKRLEDPTLYKDLPALTGVYEVTAMPCRLTSALYLAYIVRLAAYDA